MSEVIGGILIFLGLGYRVAIRAPYTNNKSYFSFIRCSGIYLRLSIILLYFSPDLKPSDPIYPTLSLMHNFMFPFHSLLSGQSDTNKHDLLYLMILNFICIFLYIIAKFLYKGIIKLKFSFYMMEIAMPDMIIYLIVNFLEFSPFVYFSQTLGFFVTLSLNIVVCVIGPIIIVHDYQEYKFARMLFTGLKETRKEW